MGVDGIYISQSVKKALTRTVMWMKPSCGTACPPFVIVISCVVGRQLPAPQIRDRSVLPWRDWDWSANSGWVIKSAEWETWRHNSAYLDDSFLFAPGKVHSRIRLCVWVLWERCALRWVMVIIRRKIEKCTEFFFCCCVSSSLLRVMQFIWMAGELAHNFTLLLSRPLRLLLCVQLLCCGG